MAADLVRRKAAVIAANTPAAPVAKAATTEIPIVFVSTGDPVIVGLVTSFDRPGGNVTGVGLLGLELEGKRQAENPKKEVSMYINSPGGMVTSGLAIYDTMQFVCYL